MSCVLLQYSNKPKQSVCTNWVCIYSIGISYSENYVMSFNLEETFSWMQVFKSIHIPLFIFRKQKARTNVWCCSGGVPEYFGNFPANLHSNLSFYHWNPLFRVEHLCTYMKTLLSIMIRTTKSIETLHFQDKKHIQWL